MANNFSAIKRATAGSGNERVHVQHPMVLNSSEEDSDDGDEEPDSDSSYEESDGESADESSSSSDGAVGEEPKRNIPSTQGTNLDTRWPKRDPPEFDTTFIGETFPAPPKNDVFPIHYFKMFLMTTYFNTLLIRPTFIQSSKLGIRSKQQSKKLNSMLVFS